MENMNSLAIVVLAAGKGTRMKSDLVKVLHPVAGTPMLSCTLELGRRLHPERLVVVVGFQRDQVRQRFRAPDLLFVDQAEQLGTGHAVAVASQAFRDYQGQVLILCADVPLLTEGTVRKFLQSHEDYRATLSVLTACPENPMGYGRIIRGEAGQLLRIVEDKDLQAGEEKIGEVNTGIYCVEAEFLFSALWSLSTQNAQREYYLTDIVGKASSQEKKAYAFVAEDPVEVMGINTRLDLARANQILWQRIAQRHMLAGVTLMDPQTAYIDGEISFAGKNLLAFSPEDMRHIRGNRIGMVFQEPMTYLNPVMSYGYQEFCRACRESGVSGLIIPDLPPEEGGGMDTTPKPRYVPPRGRRMRAS
jgi:bifunctional UDP-N-acetylglucosamine pyrophosphorylase/glucosamine-1-phosphate N-acetyltransferase